MGASNNIYQYKHVPGRHTTSRGRPLPEGPLKVLASGTYRGLSGDSQGANSKSDNLIKKLFFRSNSPCITYLFLFFTGRTNIQKSLTGTSTGRLRDQVAGRPGDQMMGCSRDLRGKSIKHDS